MLREKALNPAEVKKAITVIESERRGHNNFYVLNVRFKNKCIHADVVVDGERYNAQTYEVDDCIKFIESK